MKTVCIPGLQVKADWPLGRPIPHVVLSMNIEGEGDEQHVAGYSIVPNNKDYPEYEWMIQDFIDNHRKQLEKYFHLEGRTK
jgi:hypothetical protein